jgi:nucleotide-binding universal stress UspA family protein
MASYLGAKLIYLTCVAKGLKSGVPEREHLERIASGPRKRGLEVAPVVQKAEPARGIVEASLSHKADLIAISIGARADGRRDMVGTVVREVLTSRVEPLLLLREEDGAAVLEEWVPPPAVVVGLDGSALAATALPYVELMARSFGSEVVLVRAVLPADALSGAARYYGAVEEYAERYLAGIAEVLRQRGFKVSTRTGLKAPDVEILSAASSWPGSVIVLSTRGMTGRPNLVLGSVTERVIRSRQNPVLAIPATRPQPS